MLGITILESATLRCLQQLQNMPAQFFGDKIAVAELVSCSGMIVPILLQASTDVVEKVDAGPMTAQTAGICSGSRTWRRFGRDCLGCLVSALIWYGERHPPSPRLEFGQVWVVWTSPTMTKFWEFCCNYNRLQAPRPGTVAF